MISFDRSRATCHNVHCVKLKNMDNDINKDNDMEEQLRHWVCHYNKKYLENLALCEDGLQFAYLTSVQAVFVTTIAYLPLGFSQRCQVLSLLYVELGWWTLKLISLISVFTLINNTIATMAYLNRSFKLYRSSPSLLASSKSRSVGGKRYFTVANEDLVLVEKDKDKNGKYTGVAILKFNQPKTLNALTVAMGERFSSLITTMTNDTSIRYLP